MEDIANILSLGIFLITTGLTFYYFVCAKIHMDCIESRISLEFLTLLCAAAFACKIKYWPLRVMSDLILIGCIVYTLTKGIRKAEEDFEKTVCFSTLERHGIEWKQFRKLSRKKQIQILQEKEVVENEEDLEVFTHILNK